MKKINTYYWLVSIVCTLLLVTPVTVVYAKENSILNDSNDINEEYEEELVQNDGLDIADIYENTLMYSGKVAPDLTLALSFEGEEDQRIEIPLNNSGKFVIDFSQYTIRAGDKIIFYLTGNEKKPYEEQIEKVILEKQVGTEVILSEEQTPEEKEFVSLTTISDIYTHTKEVSGQTALGAAIYLIYKGEMTKPIYSDPSTGEFNWVFDEKQPDQYVGETFQFIFVSDGMMTVLEKNILKPTIEWETKIDEIEQATHLPDIYQGMNEYKAQTIPNVMIKIVLNNQSLVEVISDDEGLFTLDNQVLSTILADDILNFTLADSEGVYLSVEKIVLPEKEIVEEVEQTPELDSEVEEKEEEKEFSQEQLSSEKKSTKPFTEKIEDKLTSLLPDQAEESLTRGSLEDSPAIKPESNRLEPNSSMDNSLAAQPSKGTDKVDEPDETEEVEDSNFAILATIILIGTVTMSGLLYKY